jgi:ribose-phosphate pyrophosphokinase
MEDKIYSIINYPDGSSYVKVKTLDEVFIDMAYDINWKINSYNDLWQLHQYIDAVNNQGVEPTITIPCLIDQQADARFGDNNSFGLQLILKFLQDLNATFDIFHPHNASSLSMIPNIEVTMNNEFIYEVLGDIKNKYYDYNAIELERDLILMSSDAGGFKPLMKLCDALEWEGETESASKSRKFNGIKSELIQKIDRQDFEGKSILIVDDICVGGGTFIGLAKMLRDRNVGNLFLAVSHMTVQKVNPELFNVFDEVFTTNSKYDEYYVSDSKGEPVQPDNLIINKMF